MEPERLHRPHHLIALSSFLLTFVLLVETVGPSHVVPRDALPVEPSVLTPSVTLPMIEEQIAAPLVAQTPAHVQMPDPLRAIYLTGWSAGTPKRLTKALELFENSVLNAVVIDIKDATGRLSYQPFDESLRATGVGTNRIKDLQGVIQEFHKRGIYVIGRLAVFEDPFFAELYPQETYTDTRTGLPWKNFKGLTWLRADSLAVRTHIASIARDAYAQGFDEIQLDYVRFPSDGEMQYLDLSGFTKNKNETMQEFFAAMHDELAPEGIPLSADVFGLTMSNDEVGIGQKATLIAPLVDYISPMLYPSHFWNGTYGIPVPAAEPYKVIYKSLSDGIKKLEVVGIDKSKIRPWFQDFDLEGVEYTPELVRAQIQAAYDLDIQSWMMWDPKNEYTDEVYKIEKRIVEPEVIVAN